MIKEVLDMTQLERTINNVQNLLDTIENNNCSSQKEIAQIMGIAQTNVSNIINKHINTNKENPIIYIENDYYRSKIKKANKIPYLTKMCTMIEILKEKPDIYYYQNKYLEKFYALNYTEITQFRAYAEDYLRIWEIKY